MSAASAPGQGQLPYRAGTHAGFHGAMVDALGRIPELAGLRTRDADDPVVALCNAWASALDVLTFLTERTANEGFLRTAAERRSLLHLARGIGYELRPGVAADTHLAFTVIATPGTPPSFPIPPGTRAQSVPGPGELPQTFETVEPIAEARPEWNAVPVRAAARRTPIGGDITLRLARTDLALNPGDALLIISPKWFDVRRVEDVEVIAAVVASTVDLREVVAAHTLVTLDAAIVEQPLDIAGGGIPNSDPDGVQVHLMRQRCAVFGYNAVDFDELPLATRIGEIHPGILSIGTQSFANRSMQIMNTGALESDDLHLVAANDQIQYMTEADGFITGLYALRRPTWADTAFPTGTTTVFLDQAYPNIIARSWVVLERSGAIAARRVTAVAEVPKRDFGMSARVMRLTLSGQVGGFGPRTTTVLAASRRLRLAPSALPEEVGGSGAETTDTVELAFEWHATEKALSVGRTVVLSGLGPDGFPAGEVAVIRTVLPPAGAGPRLQMTALLTGTYQRSTLRVMGNAARATHGESRAEVLGSGDQRVAFPSFTVRQAPTTHTRAPTSSGSATKLCLGAFERLQIASGLHGLVGQPRVLRKVVVHLDPLQPSERWHLDPVIRTREVAAMHGVGQTPLNVAKGVSHRFALDRNGLGAATILFVEQNHDFMGTFPKNPHADFNIAGRFDISRLDFQSSPIDGIYGSKRQQNPFGRTGKPLRLPHPTDRRDEGECGSQGQPHRCRLNRDGRRQPQLRKLATILLNECRCQSILPLRRLTAQLQRIDQPVLNLAGEPPFDGQGDFVIGRLSCVPAPRQATSEPEQDAA